VLLQIKTSIFNGGIQEGTHLRGFFKIGVALPELFKSILHDICGGGAGHLFQQALRKETEALEVQVKAIGEGVLVSVAETLYGVRFMHVE